MRKKNIMGDKGILRTTEGGLEHVAGAVAEYLEVPVKAIIDIVRGCISESILPSSGDWKAESAPSLGAIHVGPKDTFGSEVPTVLIRPIGGLMANLARRLGVSAEFLLESGVAEYIVHDGGAVDAPSASIIGSDDE
jgi:hypothetical protein